MYSAQAMSPGNRPLPIVRNTLWREQVATLENALADRQQECGLLGKQLLEIRGTTTELKASAQKDVAALLIQVCHHPLCRYISREDANLFHQPVPQCA